MPIINTKRMQHPTYRSVFQHLKEGKLEIPIIQRPYAWEAEQIEDFYADISQMLEYSVLDDIENNEINIAIGQGIFYQNDGLTYVYDGQQRLLTYILFCKAASKRFLQRYNETKDDKFKKKIEIIKQAYTHTVKRNGDEDIEETRITVQQKDRDALEYILEFSKTKKKNNSLLEQAYKLITSWINKIDSDDDLDKLYQILTKKIEMLILEAKNDSDAEGLFYSTNSTGKPLSISQLLHARVHQILKDNGTTLSKWDDIYKKLNDKVKKSEVIDSYLLYAVQVEDFVITTAKVFTYINKKLKSSYGKTYIELIISRLELLYGLIYDNNDNYRAINTIVSITAIKQIYPLFIALSEMPSTTDKKISDKTIEILTYIVLQNNIVRQSPGTTKHGLADILKNILNNKDDIFEGLEKDTNTYNKIIDPSIAFDNKTGKALFVLTALYLNKNNSSLVISSTGTDLEHIVPQEYAKWTKEYPLWKEEILLNGDSKIYGFGNFLLLSKKVNQNVSNKIWEDKDGVVGKKTEIIGNPFVSIFSEIFKDDLIEQESITPEYIKLRGEKIATVFVNTLFKKFIR